MRTWLDVLARATGGPRGSAAAAATEALPSKAVPGRCAKFHSIDANSAGVLEPQWNPHRPSPERRTAAVFSHRSHFPNCSGIAIPRG